MLFLSVLEAGSPRSRYQHGQVLSGCRLLTSHCVLTWQKELWRALWGLFYKSTHLIRGLPWWLSGKEPACNCRRLRFDPWVGKIPWRRESSPVFLLGKSHRQRRLVGYIVQGIARVRQDLVTEQKQHQIPFMGVLLSWSNFFWKALTWWWFLVIVISGNIVIIVSGRIAICLFLYSFHRTVSPKWNYWGERTGVVLSCSLCAGVLSRFSLRLFATLWTSLWPARLLCPWDFPGRNTGMGCHALLQRIFPTEGSNTNVLSFLRCRRILYPTEPPGKP